MRAFRASLPWLALWLSVFALAAVAHADECNPNLVPDITPFCHLLKPVFRECRPDVPYNRDMDILDQLCMPCPAGQCVSGIDPVTHNFVCTPCGGVAMCAPFICAVGQEQIGVDSNCNPVCGAEVAAGGCTGAISSPPLEQRAVRTVSGTCSANFLPFCDVRNYGATGDGTTDDSAAFAAAITACCAGGTVYVPRSTAPYKVTQGFNNDETCFFNLLGDGATPFVEASLVHLTTALNTNCVTGPPRTCDALFDLAGGWAQDIALKGPNAFAITPGTDNENSDGLHFPGDVTRVEIKQFTTALEFPNIVRDSTISNDYIGAIRPHEIWRSEFNSHNYASVYFDGSATIASHYSSYGDAPYLWISTNGANGVTSDNDAFTAYGNAGISFAGAHAVINLRLAPFGSLTTGQNNLYKLGAVAVDNALHLGIVQGRNTIVVADDLINQAGHCHIDTLDTGGTVRFIVNNAPAVEISGTCQIDSGSSAAFTVCNSDETQCMPQAITTLTGGGTVSIPESASIYFVAASGTHLQGVRPSVGACANFAGQRVTLIFTGTITVDHESGSSTCNIALNGGSAFSAVAGNTLSLIHDGTRWRETARSTPPS